MKTTSTLIGTALLLAAGVAATTFAAGPFQLKRVQKEATPAKADRPSILSKSEVTPEPLKSPDKEPSATRALILLEEDFNNVPEGAMEATGHLGNRYVDFIASHYYEPGRYIDNEYTPNSGTWEGDWVFAGKNGTIVLQAYNPLEGAVLNTPLGDYSGDITVTVRARAAKTFWGADNEIGYTSSAGTDFTIGLNIGGYDSSETPDSDLKWGQISSERIYENDGWGDYTFTFRNEGADKDGYLSIITAEALEIDYIKVTDATTYLACPKVRDPFNFTGDSFTISWDPMRRSFNYYIDLWKVDYTTDSGISEYYDFEIGSLPEGTSANGGEIESGIGVDGSKGFRFGDNGVEAAFVTPVFESTLGSFSFSTYFDIPDDVEMNPEWGYGTLMIDGLNDDGWQPLTSVICDGFSTPARYYLSYILEGEEFEGHYKALRFYPEGFHTSASLVIDNIDLWGERPYTLTRVDGENSRLVDPENDDYAYNYYYHTEYGDPCSYTFTGLDPDTEYWYRVRSHNVNDFSIGEKHHAFGVAAPTLLEATNIGNGSYTANWTDAPKAQNYLLRNYNVTKVAADEEDYTIFKETFSGCAGSNDLFSMESLYNEEGYLDDYTDMPGWTGSNNSVGQNLIGGADYSGATLSTPALPVNPERGDYEIYLEVYGCPGDTFTISFLENGQNAYIAIPDEGYVSGYLTVTDVRAGERLSLGSLNYMAFAIGALEVTQDVKAGDFIRTFASETEVPAGIGSYTFTGLDGEMYAYQPVSQFKLEKDIVYSISGDYMVVDMANGGSFITDKAEIAVDAVETARFNTSGVRVDKDYKGLVIITMSDGSVRKEIVK